MSNYIGIDIGGTKCSVVLSNVLDSKINIYDKIKIITKDYPNPLDMLNYMTSCIDKLINQNKQKISDFSAIGISCGGPLDSKNGIILSPPNLPNWDNIKIKEYFENYYNIKTYLQNDANACALAEWKFGSGIGKNNVVFLTFGTGMGAGMILNGMLYEGTNGNAGEIGHVRLTKTGPIGYGKEGSFEGYCSGNGLKQIAQFKLKNNKVYSMMNEYEEIDAEKIFYCARKNDFLAKKIVQDCAKNLAKGLSIIIDLINPDAIIIGSIYSRNEDLLKPLLLKHLKEESLINSYLVTNIYSSKLGDEIGDYAAISVANEGDTNETFN